jgi:hypothetical protein
MGEWTRRIRKYARRPNFFSLTLTCTRRSASTLPEECYFMGLLVCPLKLAYDEFATSVVAGTGKTMLVKAVVHHTTASFIRIVGSEFVQKYLGEWCATCSGSRAKTPPLSSSSMKSTPSRQTDLTHRLASTVKSSGFCSSCSTKCMALTWQGTSRSAFSHVFNYFPTLIVSVGDLGH